MELCSEACPIPSSRLDSSKASLKAYASATPKDLLWLYVPLTDPSSKTILKQIFFVEAFF